MMLDDLVCFGYVLSLRVRLGGVFEWVGYMEVLVDLCWFVGLVLVVVIVELVYDDGIMMCLLDVLVLGGEYGLVMISIVDLVLWWVLYYDVVDIVDVVVFGFVWV